MFWSISSHEIEIKEALKRLNKNGKLIIVPAFNHLYSYYDKSIGHLEDMKRVFSKFYKKNNLIKKNLFISTLSDIFFFLLINLSI